MHNTIKKLLYWGIYFFLISGGMMLKIKNLLPIKTTSIFLLGLFWIWTGVSLIFKINLYYVQQYARNFQLLTAAVFMGLGAAWCIISLTDLSAQAIPMIIISTPFLLIALVVCLKGKKNP